MAFAWTWKAIKAVGEWTLGIDGIEDFKKNQQEEGAEDTELTEEQFTVGPYILPEMKNSFPAENFTSDKVLKYPAQQTIGPQSDYVLFEFKKYNPPFGDNPGAETYKRLGGWGGRYSWFSGDLAALNFDEKGVSNFLSKKNDYNQSNTYEPADGYIPKPGDDPVEMPAIIMYMPEDISTGFKGNWGGKAFSSIGAGILGAAGQENLASKITDGFGTITAAGERALGLTAAKILQKSVKAAGGDQLTKDDIFGGISGAIMNPNTELMFQGVDMRNFMLKFKLVPRNADESKQINEIIKLFKACTLPLRNPGQVMGFNDPDKPANQGIISGFIGVPNLCKVSFMRGSEEHQVLPRYKMLAITEVDVNYTPDGAYATYSGRSGQPVAIELTLNFQETKINFAEEVLRGSVR